MLESLAHTILPHRKLVVAVWVVLTAIGGFAAPKAANRLLTTFSIPSSQSYQHNQRIVQTFGNGDQNPMVLVFHDPAGDVTQAPGIQGALEAALKQNPGARISSYFNTGADSHVYVSKDGHTMFAAVYPVGANGFGSGGTIAATQQAIAANAPSGVQASVSGLDALEQAAGNGASGGPSILVEVAIGALGALIILLFVFGTLPAVAMPLIVAMASILNTFTLILLLTYVTDVSVIVEFLVALVGLGVAIDYSLLFIFRFREELAAGRSSEHALVETMIHAGKSVVVSGSTVGIGLLSMVILPIPFIRSIGVAGLLIPIVSVIAACTLLPAMLAIIGTGINRVRVMPRRFISQADPDVGPWARWARLVTHHAGVMATLGIAIVVVVMIPAISLNPGDALTKNMPGSGPAITGRDQLAAAGISAGALSPIAITVQGATPGQVPAIVAAVGKSQGIAGASAPQGWSRDGLTVIEAVPATDSASSDAYGAIATLENATLPELERQLGGGVSLGTAGGPPQSRDFEHTVYGNFPYLLLFVVVLTYLLLARAFRSLVLALKAVILNLISLTAAYGIIVFIFQQGHGSKPIWNIDPTGVIISWIPLMIFAFLYGISMDYEVFMLTRMREIYDDVGNTNRAIELGLARTGKLVTSAALILMFSFLVLSSSPGVDVKQFGIGLAAGIIFDATVIRALLVPSLMRLMGEWNWWMPRPAARLLFLHPDEPAAATES
ncbi:MAG TPA: MMPL family transporter [Gaiellales bacterium]|nr:MMPL family transporter [Gaiellales bacterium]